MFLDFVWGGGQSSKHLLEMQINEVCGRGKNHRIEMIDRPKFGRAVNASIGSDRKQKP
jgi:hypothetical protein